MRDLAASMLIGSMPMFATAAFAQQPPTIAVFTKNSTNPAYQAFRLAADSAEAISFV